MTFSSTALNRCCNFRAGSSSWWCRQTFDGRYSEVKVIIKRQNRRRTITPLYMRYVRVCMLSEENSIWMFSGRYSSSCLTHKKQEKLRTMAYRAPCTHHKMMSLEEISRDACMVESNFDVFFSSLCSIPTRVNPLSQPNEFHFLNRYIIVRRRNWLMGVDGCAEETNDDILGRQVLV